jgi:succinoglycan biosynthesis transport protein ExoP
VDTSIEKEISLKEIIKILKRRRAYILWIIGIALTLSAIYCTFATRRYDSVGIIEVQSSGVDALGLGQMAGGASGLGGGLDANIVVETQADILKSEALALRTAEALNLEQTRDYEPGGRLHRLFHTKIVQEPGTLADSPERQEKFFKTFSKNLKVAPETGTRLIDIQFENSDPKLAAAVVSRLGQELIDFTYQNRFDATNVASQWLGAQMGDIRKQAEELQAEVLKLQEQTGVYSLGSTDDEGRETAYSSLLDRLRDTTRALTAAQQDRILKGAIVKAIDSGNAEMVSGLAGVSLGGSTQAIGPSMAVLQHLREDLSSHQTELSQTEAKFGSAYPRVGQLQASIAILQQQIKDETGRISNRAHNDYRISSELEQQLELSLQKLNAQASELNNKAVRYAIVKREAQDAREMYEDLLKHLREAGVLEGLKSSNITIVDAGHIAATPRVPNIPLTMLSALIGSLFAGIVLALVVDSLDRRIHHVEDLEMLDGVTLLGITPKHPFVQITKADPRIICIREPQSSYTESLRAIRTSVLLSRGDKPPQVILVTSSIPGEGKTDLSTNMAAIFAFSGERKILLIDGDMRRSSIHKRIGVESKPGLSELLAGQTKEPFIQHPPDIPQLSVLAAGLVPPNPAELLSSDALTRWISVWRQQYDTIIIDATPVLPVTDAILFHTHADLTILLARSNVTDKEMILRSYNLLRQTGHTHIGTVLNAINPKDESYGRYYGYYGYRNSAYSGVEDKDA